MDEAKDPGAISNNGTQPNAAGAPLQPQAEPEVHILEERVIRTAQKPAPAASISQNPVTPAIPAEAPTKPASATPLPPVPPLVPPTPAVPAPPIQQPTPPVVQATPHVPAPPSPQVTPVPTPPAKVPTPIPPRPTEIRQSTIAEDVGLVLQTPKVPGPKTPPAPAPLTLKEKPLSPAEVQKFTPSTEGPALGNDIAKILAAVKLPERRDDAIPNEKKAPVELKKFDTGIAGSALGDESAPAAPAPLQQEPKTTSPGTPPRMTVPPSNATETKVSGRSQSSVTAVHTLKDDLQGVVYDQKISVVKAVSLEEDRRAHKGTSGIETPGAHQRSSRLFGILFASFTLLALGGGALFGVFFVMNQQKTPAQIDTGSSILFAEQSVLLSLDEQSPAELKRALESGRSSSQGALGSITRIIPVTAEVDADGVPQNRPATFREFMDATGANPPEEALRALADDFFLGVHAADKSAPLIIIPVVSHARAFAAMLAWEDALNPDLAPLFTSVPRLTQDANGVPSKRTYEDLIMRNYDVRALKDDRGEIQLYYSFPTQNILIIAESPYSFPEILSRLQASRQL